MNLILSVKNLCKKFCKGDICVANSMNLAIYEGEILTILGPSGSGKSTLLKMIAGLEIPDGGEISIGDDLVFAKKQNLEPSKRHIAFVFQNYALMPHMNVVSNITFGDYFDSNVIADVISKANLGGCENKYPHELSGGQQQRVALARALIRKPKLLLLDEPLSNVDVTLRESLRIELKMMIKRFGITALFVTHDKEDAFFISDRIAIMDGGAILQIGIPKEVYDYPRDPHCASFLGKFSQFDGKIIRPEKFIITADGKYQGVVKEVIFYGFYYEIVLFCDGQQLIMYSLLAFDINETICFNIKE